MEENSKMRRIEMLLAWDDNTWSTTMIELPSDIPTGSRCFELRAVDKTMKQVGRSDTGATLVLATIYNVPDDEE